MTYSESEIYNAVKEILGAPNEEELARMLREPPEELLTGRAEEMLEQAARRADTTNAGLARHWRLVSEILRRKRTEKNSAEIKTNNEFESFTLYDGSIINDPIEASRLINEAQGNTDPDSEHLLISGTKWFIDRQKRFSYPKEVVGYLWGLRGTALLSRSRRYSGARGFRDLRASILSYTNAIANFKLAEDDKGSATSFANRSSAYLERSKRQSAHLALSDKERGTSDLFRALDIWRKDNHTESQAKSLVNYANSLLDNLRTDKSPKTNKKMLRVAIQYYQEAIVSGSLDLIDLALAQTGLGAAHNTNGLIQSGDVGSREIRLSIEILGSALKARTLHNDPFGYAQTTSQLGRSYESLATFLDKSGAIENLNLAIKCFDAAILARPLSSHPRGYVLSEIRRACIFLSLARLLPVGGPEKRKSLENSIAAAQSVRNTIDKGLELETYIDMTICIAKAFRGLGDISGERTALEEALRAGRRGILDSPEASERTLLAQLIAGAGDALGLLRLRSDADAAAALAAVGSGRGVQLSADLVMARLEVYPDLFSLREALRTLQAAREDLARVEREVMVLRGQVEQSRLMMERSDDENTASKAIAEAEFAQSQLSNLQAERAAALSSFEAARSVYETGLSAAGLGLDPEPPSMDEIVDALPEGGVLAVPIPGADSDGGALLILGRGPDGTPEAAWSEVPGLSEDAGRELLFGEPWKEGCDEDDLAPGWFDAYNDLKGRLAKSGGVASPHGPAQTALDRAVHVMGRRLWDLIMGPLDHALRAFGAAPGAEVVMMPPGRLAALPLAAAHPEAEVGAAIRPFLTDWALSLVPSPQALIAAAGRIAALEATAGTQPARLLCVTTPKEFAPNPAADLAPLGTCREIEGPDATPEEVRAALAGHRYVAFLCHGHWNPQDPGTSGLALAGPLDAADRETVAMLTVGDLQRPGVATGDARSWLMMACETAPVGLDAPDEFAGLAVRLAGEVPAVTGTLYPVLMGHAALLGRAVLALQMGPRRLSPAQALRRAQLTAMEGGTPALEALVAEAIGPAPTASASISASVVPTPAVMSSAASFSPDSRRALGMPRDRDARALFDDFDDNDITPVDDTAKEPVVDGHDPDDWTTHIPAHWAAYTTYGR